MKVAIYCRLSDEDRYKQSALDDSESIQNQKAMLICQASRNGWTVYDIYSDDDYTGTDRNRPEFNRLIQDAKARKFDIVLCKSQSRFTRELELVEKYINGLFPRIGVRFITLVDCADTENKGNKKARQINGLVNEWFLEELSDNIRSVLTNRREQGYHIGSFAPYGYMKDPNKKGHLMIDPEAASIVRKIFDLYLQGNGKHMIARTLNECGVPNPTEYKRLHGMIRNRKKQTSPLWGYFTVSSILSNEVYIGHMIQGKTGVGSYKTQEVIKYPQEQWIVVKNTHEPIIDQDTWNNVQALISQKAPAKGTKQPEGIFAWKVRCIYCGSRMHGVKNGNKRGFKCARHALSRDACRGAYISVHKLERIVAAQLYVLSQELLDEDELERGFDPFPELTIMKQDHEKEINRLKCQIEQSYAAIRSLYMSKVQGSIPEMEYTDQISTISTDKNKMENLVAQLTEQIVKIDQTLSVYNNRKLLIRQNLETRVLTKEMVTVLIDHILVGRYDPATKETPVEIHWNF